LQKNKANVTRNRASRAQKQTFFACTIQRKNINSTGVFLLIREFKTKIGFSSAKIEKKILILNSDKYCILEEADQLLLSLMKKIVGRNAQLSFATGAILSTPCVHGSECVNRKSFNSLNVHVMQNNCTQVSVLFSLISRETTALLC
jgi:hypothetical protein